ncbi:MAG: ribose-5-phosphate isomerase A, partial [Fischerella sp.]|nr:ribose-5-phosphate isomerase A [Fischerella sp.]
MSAATDAVKLMKQEVGKAAAALVKSGYIVGLGTGSTTAYAIQYIGERLKSGELKDIVGVTTSFQADVLAKQYGIPLTTLDAIDHIDIAIDVLADMFFNSRFATKDIDVERKVILEEIGMYLDSPEDLVHDIL